jgi:hypothetical protein
MEKAMWQKKDILKAGTILIGAALVMWGIFIRPHSYDWQAAGQTQAMVKTLMSNSKVIGQPVINAVVILEGGQEAIVSVPLNSDIRKGDDIILSVQKDADRPSRRRYQLLREIP